MKQFTVVIEKDEDFGFVGHIPALKGCHTQADTLDELMVRIKEAAELCIEEMKEDLYIPEFVGITQVEIAI